MKKSDKKIIEVITEVIRKLIKKVKIEFKSL